MKMQRWGYKYAGSKWGDVPHTCRFLDLVTGMHRQCCPDVWKQRTRQMGGAGRPGFGPWHVGCVGKL